MAAEKWDVFKTVQGHFPAKQDYHPSVKILTDRRHDNMAKLPWHARENTMSGFTSPEACWGDEIWGNTKKLEAWCHPTDKSCIFQISLTQQGYTNPQGEISYRRQTHVSLRSPSTTSSVPPFFELLTKLHDHSFHWVLEKRGGGGTFFQQDSF